MVAVRMVQVAVYQVIHMVAMRNRFVSASRAMHMVRGMAGAGGVQTCGFVADTAITCSST